MKFIGHVDVNSFYCSCETVFRPDLRNRPVIVLSNNDGCAIAFNKKAKSLGFGLMCEPYFQIKQKIKKYNVAVFSSNYTLYDNMSKRVMDILKQFTTQLEVYSVDEAFLDLEGHENLDLNQFAKNIRSSILQQTGLPVGVGISKTKVLAKIANKIAKKENGVCILENEDEINQALLDYPVRDIWGIGSRSASKLYLLGIKTAYDLKFYPDDGVIQKHLTKIGRQIQDELRGISCLEIEQVEDKNNIASTRSFGGQVFSKEDLREALAEFATHAAEKLRKQKGICFGLTAFIRTNYNKEVPQYYGEGRFQFLSGTSDTLRIINGAHRVLDDVYKRGFEYKKGGIILNHIVPQSQNQLNLFDPEDKDNQKLSLAIDLINKRYGRHTIKSAACGINPQWRVHADFKSKRYTTCWDEILRLKI